MFNTLPETPIPYHVHYISFTHSFNNYSVMHNDKNTSLLVRDGVERVTVKAVNSGVLGVVPW